MAIKLRETSKAALVLLTTVIGLSLAAPASSLDTTSLLTAGGYPGVVFLIRKIGTDYNDDCGDNSLTALMNISRSGDSQHAEFLWERHVSKYTSTE